MFKLLIVLFFFTLSGCSHTQKGNALKQVPSPTSLINHDLFNPVPITLEAQIFALPEVEQNAFKTFASQAITKQIRADRIIADYLKFKVDNFSYDGATLTASEVISQNEGNCISLAILTQAYANLIGIETGFSEVASMPVYKQKKQTILISSHFKTKLYAPLEKNKDWLYFMRPGTVIDYFPVKDIVFVGSASYHDLVAKYYANLATEALLKKQFNLSYSLLQKAFEYTPYDPELISLTAILHRRNGDTQSAQRLFAFAYKHNFLSSNLLYNYRFLAQQLGQTALVNELDQALHYNAKTPFDFIQLAEQAISRKQYLTAENILNKLLLNTPYLPEPYFALAKINYLRGDLKTAQNFLQSALDKAEDQQKKGIYQAKLNTLKQFGIGYN
ncbi:hypothetical protein PSECIP111854_03846 [Pseudoalteromonas sp. CIP111854]|uniref:Tetratricopeptide repeat protein 21A/21B second ARM domain-containing protein n=1 Tax=Pseudoalteromonas holothuriae TaxID=2963714 RepID=A0A9W4R3A3_9GAMM|nr:hypothetical protein [Pseudoalteromonas sp. CIP111854]CAH9066231.1 hypothetical protein PSECIP111854_03846 [Pseudoalteromonas sp. CIP111854]